ncbi:MAG: hypothetical protein AAGJ17_03990 [Pseudomonadota bacterium]
MEKRISTNFNLFATAALLFVLFLYHFFTVNISDAQASNSMIDLMFASVEAKVLFTLALLTGVSVTASFIFKEIWNRLFSDLFHLREINLNEAYATCFLVLSIIAF